MAIIEVDNLTKDYGHGRGIYSVLFQIDRGEVFGFLGPNGDGKTTTIRHLMGFSNPERGFALINGMRCDRKASKILHNVGYLPGEIALPEGLTGWEFIRMLQRLWQTPTFCCWTKRPQGLTRLCKACLPTNPGFSKHWVEEQEK